MRHNHTYLLFFSLVAFLLIPHTAFAKESAHKPIASLRVSVISGIPDILGASLSLKMFHPFELEAGASSLVLGYSFYGKAGASLQIFDNRLSIGTGWSVRGLLMGGYRFIQGEIFGNATSHAVMLTAGLEATLWLFAHFGLELQLSAGAGYMLDRQNTSNQDLGFFPDLRASLGIAF